MAELAPHQLAVLAANPWYAGLDAAVRADMLARAHLLRLAAGERLFSRGDPGDLWYAVVEGSIRISGSSREGREAVLTLFEPGNWFGEIALLDGGARTHDAVAHAPSLLLKVNAGDFEALLARHAGLARSLLRLQCLRLRSVLAAFEANATQTLEQRFASRLLALATAYGSPTARGLSIELHLSQEILAQIVGVTRQRVNQLLKGWESEGLIEQRYGRLLVVDHVRLERLAQA